MFWKIAAAVAGGAVALTLATGYVHVASTTAAAQQTTPTPAQPSNPARPGKAGAPRGGFGIFGSEHLLLRGAVSVTGLTAEQLRTELAAGKSLAQIAQEQGKTGDDIIKAARAEYETALKQALTDGRLNQAQVDARLAVFDADAAQLINRTNLKFGPGQGGPKGGAQRGPGGMQRGGDAIAAIMKAVTSVTGLTTEQLRTELAAGKSLAQIAQEKGKTADDLIKAARSALQTTLSEAVTAGKLTQARADEVLARFDKEAPELVNRTFPARSHKPANPAPTPTGAST